MPRRSIEGEKTRAKGAVVDMRTGEVVSGASIPVICERIRHFRKLAGYEQAELGQRVGVKASTVSNWETGRAKPDINLIPQICSVLGINIPDLFGSTETRAQGTVQKQQELIDKYGRLTPGNRHAVDTMIDTLLQIQEAESVRPLVRRLFFQKSLAAGIGDPTELDGKAMPVYLYQDMVEKAVGRSAGRKAGCIFAVNGDSMEPAYRSGELVLVERIPDAPRIRKGEVGAFIVGNEMYIKEYSPDGLVSLNPSYPMMRFDAEAKVYLIGRVVGKLPPQCIAVPGDVEKYCLVHETENDTENRYADEDSSIVQKEFIDRYLR